MIEYRAMLRKNLDFSSGFAIPRGAFIYVRETEVGWIGTYYTDKGSAHSFALDPESFSIVQSGAYKAYELVVTPDPPTPPEKVKKELELAKRRIEHQIAKHRQEAEELEALLADYD